MARFKPIDTHPKLLAVDLAAQLLPGTFEHALHHLLAEEIDRTRLEARYRNDTAGAPAYPPRMLLQVVLFAYSRGIVSSRAIARACTEHVTFIALCGDTRPHFTTIAQFVSTLGADIAPIFAAVLAVCDRQGLIGREMFAIDGVKLPSNASKRRSGTRADFARQAAKLETAAATMLARHRATDALPVEPALEVKAVERIARLERDAAELRDWLAAHPADRRGAKGSVRQSNRTDNDSAKMATGKGVIQGYTGVAAVDAAHQVIVDAPAHGTGSEHELLVPVVTATDPWRAPHTVLTADTGYHSEANLRHLATQGVPAVIADCARRRRRRSGTWPSSAAVRTTRRSRTRRACAHGSTRRRGAPSTTGGSGRWSPCSATCARTSDSTASRCAAGSRSMRSGSCTASSTTSRSSRTRGTRRSSAADAGAGRWNEAPRRAEAGAWRWDPRRSRATVSLPSRRVRESG